MQTTYIPFRWAQLLIATLLALTIPCSLRAQENIAPPGTVPVINMRNTSLSASIYILATQCQLNYILDPHLADNSQVVSFTWRNVTAREGLNRLLKEHDLELIENPATTVARIAPRNLHIKPVDPALGRWVTNVVTSSDANDTNTAVLPIIAMGGVPLDVAIQTLGTQAKLTIVLDEGSLPAPGGQPAPMVDFRWQNLTARQALAALLDCYDLTLAESPDTAVIHIKPKAKS